MTIIFIKFKFDVLANMIFKKNLFFGLLSLFAGIQFAMAQQQIDHFKSFEKKMTPSPTVAAMETYGGMELKKNTGGIQKSISLFTLTEGDITYTPSVEYFSTGIKVDDWGSNVGMGWADNMTAVITRTVKGVPDERAYNRIGDTSSEFGGYPPVFNQTNYDKVSSLAVPNTNIDGEYDVFSYNIFGNSGSFFIKNGQALLINDNNSIKIQLLATNPHKFLLTDVRGYQYYFDDAIETTHFDSSNACDEDNPYANGASIPTAWFLSTIISPNKHKLEFMYSSQSYNYFYDFTDYWFYSAYHPIAPSFCTDGPLSGTRTSCLRKKTTATKMLEFVKGDNFIMILDYVNREDIYGGKLLKKIEVFNGIEKIKVVDFSYKNVIASTTVEPIIAANILDPWEENSIKIRHFLEAITIHGDASGDQRYKFRYKDVQQLPHRFSLSKDFMGCYNAQPNSGLVPREAINALGGNWDKSLVTIPFANRKPALIGMVGLISSITYPTGGKDSIEYEPNQFKYRKPNQTVVDSTYAMYRVKRVLTQSGNGIDIIKRYRYNVFTKADDLLLFTDSSSLVTREFDSYVAIGVHVCQGVSDGGQNNFYQHLGGLSDYPLYTVRDQPITSPHIYGGLPYSYNHVTEFYDEAETSFTASKFISSPNGNAGRDVVGYYYPILSVVGAEPDNLAWDHGLETKRFTGEKKNGQYLIIKENSWNYSNTSQIYQNYAASKACEIYNYSSINLERMFGAFIVKTYELYRHWTKLDSISEISYFRNNGSYSTIDSKVRYRYSNLDKQIEEEETYDSNQDVLLKQIVRPARMINLGLDPTGVYQAMVNKHFIAPEVKVYQKTNGAQTAMIFTNYYQPFSGLFVPQQIISQRKADDLQRIRLKFLHYDTFGNVLSIAKEDGVSLNYLYSYKSKYPVIKIIGPTYAAIQNLLSIETISTLSNKDGRNAQTMIGDLANYSSQIKTAFPKAQISTYRYIPSVGMVAETDAKGMSTYYTYDQFQRLKMILGEDGIIKSFDYHFKGN